MRSRPCITSGRDWPATVGLARRGRQEPEKPRSHQGPPLRAGRFGRFVARTRGFGRARPGDDRPTDCDRHPGVGTSVGPYRTRASAVFPLDELPEARTPVTTPDPLDPAADRPGRPARPARRARAAVRARPTSCRASGSSSARGSAGSPTTSRTPVAIPFADLPGWPAATAPGHVGRLLLGRLGGTPVVMLQGRFHIYEGNDPGLVVQPVLLFRRLGARDRRPDERGGRRRPRVRAGDADGDRRPPQPDRADAAPRAERRRDRAALPGPDRRVEPAPARGASAPPARPRASSWRRASTPACSGRSTRPRRRSGCCGRSAPTRSGCRRSSSASPPAGPACEVCGVSLVTNAGAGYSGEPLSHEEVLAAGAEAGPRLARVIRRFVAGLASGSRRPDRAT